jgi:hypothetical protein
MNQKIEKKMKKITVMLAVLFGYQNCSLAQSIAKGTSVLYLGLGPGSGFGYAKKHGMGYTYRSSPSIHLGFEHGISEAIPESVIGLGGSLSYWGASQNYRDVYGDGYDSRWNDLRVLFKGYYHHKFLVSDKWDVYAAVMLGFKYRTFTYTPVYTRYSYVVNDESGVYGAGGVAIGGRFYVTPNFGFYAEAGAGANVDYIQAGLAFKF